MKHKKIILFFTFLIVQSVANAQVKYSNDFLSIGVGARGLGMGGAQVAIAEDATAAYWNPAGILGVKSNVQVAAMHADYFAGIAKYDFGGFVVPRDSNKAIGFTVIRLGVDDIPNTIDLIDAAGNINYDRLKSFAVADYAFMLTYSVASKVPGLRYGGNAKVVYRNVGEFAHAWGFGLDFGAQYQKGKWHFGAFGQDITSTFNAWSFTLDENVKQTFIKTNNEIPANSVEVTLPKLIIGTGYKTNISSKISWLTELDLVNTFDGKRNTVIHSDPISVDPHVGMEFGYDNFIFLRGGVTNIQTVKDLNAMESTVFQPSLGLGLKLKNLSIDWALTNVGDDLYSNVFSLKLDIYKHK